MLAIEETKDADTITTMCNAEEKIREASWEIIKVILDYIRRKIVISGTKYK